MAYLRTTSTNGKIAAPALLIWPMVLGAAIVAAYIPTYVKLAQGPWQTEQEGHGPLIIAAALWLAWECRGRLKNAVLSPAPLAGWTALLGGLALMFLARTQDFLPVEAFSEIPVIAGCVLLISGWGVLRILLFPIAFLVFAVPVPDTITVAATVPLKVLISDSVTEALYTLGYPIAQNGVMIMIGSYQLLVKDACSGMNSIFALSAICLFYVYVFRWNSKLRGLILLAMIVPITIIANFIRVAALVLIAYYGGVDLLDGALHDLTGIALFVVAIVLMFLADGVLGLFSLLLRKMRPSSVGLGARA
jgi:exosortase B